MAQPIFGTFINPPPLIEDENLKQVVEWVTEQLQSLARRLVDTTALELRPIYAAPLKPRTGMVVYADGTEWDPGSGEGVYAYNAAGSWVLLS